MTDDAKLVCFDDGLALPVGMFFNREGPRGRRLWAHASAGLELEPNHLSIESPLVRSALRRFLAEHLDHNVQLVGETSPAWTELPKEDCRIIGWDDFPGGPPLAEYAAGPLPVPLPQGAGLACGTDGASLPLHFSGSLDEDREVFAFVAEHVYHDVHLLGDLRDAD